MLQKYEVGKTYMEAKGHVEGCRFDISDSGATLIFYYDRPTKMELENFKPEKPFEMRMMEFSNTIIFLLKFGNLNWMDAPYTPHLSKDLTCLDLREGEGLAITIMLFDTSNGELKQIRLMSLSYEFTMRIKNGIEKLMRMPFDKMSYYNNINRIFSAYSTNALVKMSRPGFKSK